MGTSADSSIDKQTRKIEKLRALQGKTATLPYVLNVFVPGLGNIFFGRMKTGIVLVLVSLVALFMLVAGAASFQIGLLIAAISVIGALFTAGLSLILLPVAIFLIFFGAGGPIIAFLLYVVALMIAEYLVYKTAQDVSGLPIAILTPGH